MVDVMLSSLSNEELERLSTEIDAQYANCCDLGFKLNMARGIPSLEQLQLSQELLVDRLEPPYVDVSGVDARNYGGQAGLLESRALFSELLEAPVENVVVGGSSSLALMYEWISQAWRVGTCEGDVPWSQVAGGISFICIVPGYDRHFAMCEDFGIKMIAVPMLEDGPDINMIKDLVLDDPSIKGVWSVPKYSNPTGTSYSTRVIYELASMPVAARDFRIFWDNAYAVHPLAQDDVQIANIHELCAASGYPDRSLVFASTSKMTLPGSGMAAIVSSKRNTDWWLERAKLRSVGPDKISQLRQTRFLKSADNVKLLMGKHRDLLAPKFAKVDEVFSSKLSGYDFARWTKPKGGYFVSLNVAPGTASRVVELADNAGVSFAVPGSCFPGAIDPTDSQLRIAPSYPPLDDLTVGLEVVAVSVLKAAVDQAKAQRG